MVVGKFKKENVVFLLLVSDGSGGSAGEERALPWEWGCLGHMNLSMPISCKVERKLQMSVNVVQN